MPAKKKKIASKKKVTTKKRSVVKKSKVDETSSTSNIDAQIPQPEIQSESNSSQIQTNSSAQITTSSGQPVVAAAAQMPSPVAPTTPQNSQTPSVASGVDTNSASDSQQTLNQAPSSVVPGSPMLSSTPPQKMNPIDEPSGLGIETLPGEQSEKKSIFWLIIVIAVLLLAFGAGGFFYYSQFVKKAPSESEKAALTPTHAPENQGSPSSSEIKEVKLDEYNIKVLNGSGVRGEAGKVKGDLEKAGFTVGEIGNADNSEYEKTVIQNKKDIKKGFLDKLKEQLEKTYKLDKNEELPSSASDEIIVIIGSSKAASESAEE